MRQSGADAERRLRQSGASLPKADRLIRDAPIAAYRCRAERDGARLRPARLRRRQHEHHLPRPLDRRDRVRADLCRDEPARRGPLRASGGNRDLLALHRRLQFPGVGRHLAGGRDLCVAHDRQADPAPLPEHQIHRAASGRPRPDAAQSPRQARPEPERPPQPRRGAERDRQEILLRHGVLRLQGGVHLRPRSLRPRSPGDRQRLSGLAGLRRVQRHLRLYRAAGPTKGRHGQDPAPQRASASSVLLTSVVSIKSSRHRGVVIASGSEAISGC